MDSNKESSPLAGIELLSIRDLVNIIRHRWILGASVGLAAAALLAIYCLNQPTKYQATASIIVELNTEQVVNVQEVVESGLQNSGLLASAMNTHIERLKSRMMAEAVVQSLNDDQLKRLLRPRLENGDHTALPRETREMIAVGFLTGQMLKVYWQNDSQVLRITVQHENARVAQSMADRYAKLYIREQLVSRGQSNNQAVSFLDQQTEDLQARLEAEEQALHTYRMDNNLVSVEQNQSIINERMRELNSVITKARVALLNVESRIEQVDRAGQDLDQLMSLPFVGGDSEIEKVFSRRQEIVSEREVLSQTFLERHPKMIANAAAQESAEAALWGAIRQTTRSLRIEQSTLLDELSRLENKLVESEEAARQLETVAVNYRVLSKKVDARRDILNLVTTRLNEASVAQQMELTSMRILDYAALPVQPFWPAPKKIALAALLIFAVLFISLPLGVEFLDNRLRSFHDIEGFVGKNILADLPELRNRDERELARLSLESERPEAERFRSLFARIQLKLGTIPPASVFLVTSSVPQEGKSMVVANLAQIFAAHKLRTIVVDLDLRRPTLHRLHSLDNDQGILEWIRSDQPLADDIREDPILGIKAVSGNSPLSLLRAGGNTRESGQVITNPRLDEVFSRLRQSFDVILIDTPPIGLFQDATLAATYADHTLFVARQNATTRQKCRHAIQTMDQSPAKVLGVVFNGVRNARAAASYGASGSYAGGYAANYDYGRGKRYEDYIADYDARA